MTDILRPMRHDDFPAAAALWHEGWHDGHADHVPAALTALRTLDNFSERLHTHRAQAQVSVRDGIVQGFVITRDAEIYQMYAARSARGTGIAGTLLTAGETSIAAAGHSIASLDCAIGNARAARFYEKQGWSNTGEVETQLDTSEGLFPLILWRFEKSL